MKEWTERQFREATDIEKIEWEVLPSDLSLKACKKVFREQILLTLPNMDDCDQALFVLGWTAAWKTLQRLYEVTEVEKILQQHKEK